MQVQFTLEVHLGMYAALNHADFKFLIPIAATYMNDQVGFINSCKHYAFKRQLGTISRPCRLSKVDHEGRDKLKHGLIIPQQL